MKIELGKVHIIENERLFREVILVNEPSLIYTDIWSINSPMITDCEMANRVHIGGRPIILYDPIFINDFTTFLRNVGDQNYISVHSMLQKIIKNEDRDSDK